jgi:tetratricopeptide (TPR) repeat protein
MIPVHIRKYIIHLILIIMGFICSCNPYSLPEDKSKDISEIAYAHYMQAQEYYDNEDYENALMEIQQAIDNNNRFALFYQLQGDIYAALYNNTNALAAYKNSIKYRSNFPEVHRKIGQIHLKMGAYEDALKAFRKVRANDPSDFSIYLLIAECYIEMGELEIAYNELADYRRQNLVKQQPLEPDYHRLLGITFFRLKRYEDAIRELSEYNKTDSRDPYILELLGKSYYQARDFESGLNCFNLLIKIDETAGEWYMYRGIYFYQKADYQDAESQLLYALELDNTLAEAHLFLGKIYESQGKVKSALDHLKKYRSIMRESVELDKLEETINDLENLENTKPN